MLTIREATINDLQAMLAIYNEAILNQTSTFDLEEQTMEQRKIWFSKYGSKYPLIVADFDGQVVGYASLSPFRDKEAYDKTVEISVYIDKGQRGRGIGKALMAKILELAKTLNYHTVIAGITAGNEVSVKIHENFGFEYIGCFKEVGYKFNQWQDVLFYQKMI